MRFSAARAIVGDAAALVGNAAALGWFDAS